MLIEFFSRCFRNIKHKISFWTWPKIKEKFLKYGLPFFVILVVWEIFEDVVFPIVAYLLGKHVDPLFYSFIPVAWIVCLHPIAVPVMWYGWCFIRGEKKPKPSEEDCCD